MKKVVKDYENPPISLQVTRGPYIKAIDSVIKSSGWYEKASKLYAAKSVKDSLKIIYKKKCAFCELRPLGSPLQVEHFRPKDKIKDTLHSGYYWLAYEWTNLILICPNCNTFKSNRFPLHKNSQRVADPIFNDGKIDLETNVFTSKTLLAEKPLLINPEIDDPSRHLFHHQDGKLTHTTTKGKVSIEIYNLNRDELYVNGRKKAIDSFHKKIMKRFEGLSKGRTEENVTEDISNIITEDLIYPILNHDSFTSFYQNILLYFEDFIIERFPDTQIKEILNNAYLESISTAFNNAPQAI